MKQPPGNPKRRTRTPLPVDARVTRLRNALSSGGQTADAAILQATRDRSPIVRATAAELIAKESNVSFLGSLHEMLSDPSGLVRGEVIEALGVVEEGSGRHHEDLASRLRDVKPMVRIAAIETLAKLQDLVAIPGIESRLQDQDPLVRAYAAIALAELGGSTCLPSILNALAAEADDTAAAGLLVAIRLLGDETEFEALLALLSSSRYRVRCFVANRLPHMTLTHAELRSARAAVQEALNHPLGRADASTMSRVLVQLEGRSGTLEDGA